MSTFSSFSSFTSWFTAQPTGFSQSQLQLEKARDFSWRKGYDKHRWSDYRMLWSVVKGRAKQLTAAASADDVASYADAAAALDLQYNLNLLSEISAYFTQYLKKKGSKAAVSDSSSGQAAAGRSSRKGLAQQLVEQQGEVEEAEEEVEDKEPSRQARGRGKGGKRKGAKKGRGS
jgi:hypothetical protein